MDAQELFLRLSNSRTNVAFGDFERLLRAFGFRMRRQRGSHQVWSRPGVRESLSVQSFRGEAKTYQIAQFLKLVATYNLTIEDRT